MAIRVRDDGIARSERDGDAAVSGGPFVLRLVKKKQGEYEATGWAENAAQEMESLSGSTLRPGPGDLTRSAESPESSCRGGSRSAKPSKSSDPLK